MKKILFALILTLLISINAFAYNYYVITNLSTTQTIAIAPPYMLYPGASANIGETDYNALLDDVTYYVGVGKMSVTGPFVESGTEPIKYATGATTETWGLLLDALGYINWGTTIGASGYGFRISSGNIQFKHSGGSWADVGSTPGGNDTNVQFNDGGSALGGDDDFVWNKTSNILTVVGVVKADTVKINDSNDSHTLEIKTTSDLTADKALTIVTGDADRTLTLSGNATISDWFDQSVKQASSPTFNAITTLTTPLSLGNGGTGKNITASANRLVYSDADSFELLATGNSGLLVTDGSGVPSIATDIPTAVTIGGSYIYRAGGSVIPTSLGGSPATKTIELVKSNPYPDGSSNSGILADYYDSTNFVNYTRWTSGTATQDYGVVYTALIPTDFTSFPTGALSVSIRSNDKDGNVHLLYMYINDNTVDAGVNGADIKPSANDTWEAKTDTPTGSYSVGHRFKVIVKLGNDEANNTVDVGRIFLTYNTR